MKKYKNISQQPQIVLEQLICAGNGPGCPQLNLRKSDTEHKIYPYLLGDGISNSNNHVCGNDIAYIHL